MTRTPPTLDALKDRARALLADAKAELLERTNIIPKVVLGDSADGEKDCLMLIQPEVMGSVAEKVALSKRIREEINAHGYFNVVMITDTFHLKLDPKHSALAYRLSQLGLGAVDMSRLGLGELVEQLTATVEAVTCNLILYMEYKRAADGTVIHCEEIQETPQAVKSSGRFTFFPQGGE